MNTRHLETFVAVVEKGSFSKAAQELVTTPSALTQQVNALERELGFPLLARDYRGAEPTPGGQVFYEHAKKVLEIVREGYEQSREAAGLTKSVVRFKSYRNFGLVMLGRARAEFSRACPDVDVQFLEGDYRRLLDELLEGRIDLYMHPWASELDRSDIGFQKTGTTGLACSMSYDHPLAGAKTLKPTDLIGCDVIIGCGCGSHVLDGLAEELSDVGDDIRIHRMATDDEVWNAVLTKGYLFMNMAHTAKYMGGCVSLPLDCDHVFDHGFVYRVPCSKGVRKFLDFISAHPEMLPKD